MIKSTSPHFFARRKSRWTSLAPVALLAAAPAAPAATVSLLNVGNPVNPVTDSTGQLLPAGTGIVTTGYFLSEAEMLATLDVAGQFVPLNPDENLVIGFEFEPGTSLDGLYSGGISAEIGVDDAIVGQPVYTVIGNGSTLATSTEFLVYRHNDSFDPPPFSLTTGELSSGADGTLLVGEFGLFTGAYPDLGQSFPAFNLVGATPAAPDTDGDGLTDEAEQVAGTNPNDPHSRFAPTEVALDPGGVRIAWSSVAGKVYAVEFTDDLAVGDWQVVAAAVNATGGVTEFTAAVDAGLASGFYRVAVNVP